MSDDTQITNGDGESPGLFQTFIGGGFAGVEAAWQAAERGAKVRLYEMRPVRPTPAHRTA